MNEEGSVYSHIFTDSLDLGVRMEVDANGEISIYDDPKCWYTCFAQSFDEVFDELYECWHERIKQKRYTLEAYHFERNIGRELGRLTREILDLTWRPRGYFDFYVQHPVRLISAPYYGDRIVEQWLTDKYVKPYIDPQLSPNNVACRKGYGPMVAQNYLKAKLKELRDLYGNQFYFLQCDIEGYYDNVSHERIKEMFSGMPLLGYVLFCNIIDDWVQEKGYAAMADPDHRYGVPKGNLPSQWVGIRYLNDIDWYVSGREDCLGYMRYMDDFIAFFKDKASCKDCKIQIEKILLEKRMGVRLHKRKTRYSPIHMGFSFCGWHYVFDGEGKVKMRTKPDRKRINKNKFKKMTEDYYLGKLSLKDVEAKLNGSYAFLRQGDTKQMRRYFSHRFRFTHDEDLFYKEKPPCRKKRSRRRQGKENNIDS